MSSETATNSETEGTTEATPQAPIVVNGQYIKDLSFEVPGAPAVFGQMQNHQPDIGVNVDVNARNLQDNLFEVILEIRAECKVGDQTGFIAELSYGGMFTVNVPKEHMEPVLLIECPRMVFPFARNILADVTRDGGFPPLMLGMIDFAGMYQNRLAQSQAEGQAEGGGEEKPAES